MIKDLLIIIFTFILIFVSLLYSVFCVFTDNFNNNKVEKEK